MDILKQKPQADAILGKAELQLAWATADDGAKRIDNEQRTALLSRSLTTFIDAERTFDELGLPREAAFALGGQAFVYASLGDQAKAQASMQQAVVQFEKDPLTKDFAKAVISWFTARELRKQGQRTLALNGYRNAILVARASP